MVRGYRVVQKKYSATALNGEGAALYGGRWNSKGKKAVYVSSTISLAILEILVHLDDYSTLAAEYCAISVEFDDSLVTMLADSELPGGWDSPAPNSGTQLIGDRWILSNSSVVLEVPSVVVPLERNFLINSNHPAFGKIRIGEPVCLGPESRF